MLEVIAKKNSRRGSGPGALIENLEERRLMSLADVIDLPFVTLDIPGTASATPVNSSTRRLDIKATVGTVTDRNGVTTTSAIPIIEQISVIVKKNGDFSSGVTGDDLKVFLDNDHSGTFTGGDTVLLSGEARSDMFSVMGVTVEAVFKLNPTGAWAMYPYFALPNGTLLDAGVQIDLSGPNGGTLDFNAGFSNYSPKGVMGSLPPPMKVTVGRGSAATIGFWANKNGQAVINSLNGGPSSTMLANWLASHFPNMYGSLAGMTNAQVAAFYIAVINGTVPKVDAQVLGTALSVYVSDPALGGGAGSMFGFKTSLGPQLWNVGKNGAAFGLPNNTVTTVMNLLTRVDDRSFNGLLWDENHNGVIDPIEQTHRLMGNEVFNGINEKGDII